MLSFGDVKPHADKIKKAGALMICQCRPSSRPRTRSRTAPTCSWRKARRRRPRHRARHLRAGAGGGRCGARHSGRGGRRRRGRARARGRADARRRRRAGRHALLCDAGGRRCRAAKERIVAASGDKTIRSILFDIARRNVWPAPYTGRVLRNEFSERWRGREAELMQHQAEEAARYDKRAQRTISTPRP
jgi:nitronate monooxygenase